MASRTARAFVLGALALSSAASAFQNYSSSYAGVEALRAQLALMDDRPNDCPPWFVLALAPFNSVCLPLTLSLPSWATLWAVF